MAVDDDLDVNTGSSPDDDYNDSQQDILDDYQDDDGVDDRDASPSADDDFGVDKVPLKNRAREVERKLDRIKNEDPELYAEILGRHRQAEPQKEPEPDEPKFPWQTQNQQAQTQASRQQDYSQPQDQPKDVQQQQSNQLQTYEELIADVERRAEQKAEQKVRHEIAIQRIEQKITSDYEDLNNPASDMFRATAYYLQNNYRGNPLYAEEAAMRAALDLGIQPKSRQIKQPQAQARPLQRNSAPLPSMERGRSTGSQKDPLSVLTPGQIATCKRLNQDPKKLAAFVRKEMNS